MSQAIHSLEFHSEQQTADFAHELAFQLCAGDTILLEGDIGAGKSFLARQVILSLLTIPEDIPSPTFTLIQSYSTRSGEVVHADLYRLSTPDELEELGLSEAFETSICLIEWPDRLGSDAPQSALKILLETGADLTYRKMTLTFDPKQWGAKLTGLLNG